MSTAPNISSIQREPELLGQTLVVIGGSAGIGLETARRACAEGAKLILTGGNPERQRAASEFGALLASMVNGDLTGVIAMINSSAAHC